jgi:pimeloyl-ACP methyl ester carboxylesterase
MRSFEAGDGVEIAYQVWGPETERPPVLLHHGFTVDAESNWVAPGVVAALVEAGRRVVAPDARGHGRSAKPHDPESYGEDRMALDLGLLVEEIGAMRIDLVGYSMGAIVSLLYASAEEGVRRLAIGGVGSGVIECGGVDRRWISEEEIIGALEEEDVSRLEDGGALRFRQIADAVGGDRLALAAQARGVFRGEIALDRVSAPTLLLAGESDPLAVRPEVLVEAIPDARLQLLDGDHFTALGDPRFAQGIVEHLAA